MGKKKNKNMPGDEEITFKQVFVILKYIKSLA